MQAGEWDAAIKAFKQMTEKDPTIGAGWFQLAYCTHMSGDLDAAIDLHKKAAEFAEFRPIALYNVGCVHALKGRTEDAFKAIEKAIDAGFNDANQLRGDDDLKSLRDDKRFEALLARIKEAGDRRNVGVLVYDGVDLLDVAGPAQVFASAGSAFRVFTVGVSTKPIRATAGMTITPEFTIESAPRADILVVPGGPLDALLENKQVVSWVQRSADNAEIVMSVCSGALLLAKAGLLDGREATTYPQYLDKLREAAPKAKVVEAEYVDAGVVITCDGNSGGIDAALHVVGKLAGKDTARAAMKSMAYRPGGRALAEPH